MTRLGVEAIPASQQQLFLRRFVTVSAELSVMSREWLEPLLEFLSRQSGGRPLMFASTSNKLEGWD